MQGFGTHRNLFLLRDRGKVRHHGFYAYTVKIEYLAPGQDSGKYFMFFCRGQNKEGIGGWLFQGFQECIKSCLGEHMYFVYDIDAVIAYLGRYAHFIYELSYVVNRVVGGCIEFMNAVGPSFGERSAGFAFTACFHFFCGIEAIDGFGKNACASGLAHAPGPAKKICMCQLAAQNGIF